MYTPRSFQEDDLAVLHDLIRNYSFGVLFTQVDGESFATHLPFMIDSDRGKNGTLLAHFARANPHWKMLSPETRALVVFQGPHCYISPGWYDNKEYVPTWNYAAVHIQGPIKIIEDHDELRAMVLRLSDKYEAKLNSGWDVDKAMESIDSLLPAITGFEIPIEKIEGKFKFNQNLSEGDREGVIAKLKDSDDSMERGVAQIMVDRRTKDSD